MEEKEVLKVSFRYDKKYSMTTMFFYDEYKTLECFTMQDGHNVCCYDYYLSCKLIKDIENNEDVQRIIKYYENYPNGIKLDIKEKLTRG